MVQKFTIDGTTYVPFQGMLLRYTGEVATELAETEENTLYLYDDTVVQFEETVGSSYRYFPQAHPDDQRLIGEESDTRFEVFSGAEKLGRVVPDGVVACPNCGSKAGAVDDPDAPMCFQCGYGTEEGVYEDRDE